MEFSCTGGLLFFEEQCKESGVCMNDFFNKCYVKLRKLEGGYANNPVDPGQETIFGISRRFHEENYKELWDKLDSVKAEFGTEDIVNHLESDPGFMKLVRDFYYSWWKDHKCNLLSSELIAWKLYEFSFNAGTQNGVKVLQRSLNYANKRNRFGDDLVVDGIIGTKTVAMVNQLHRNDIINAVVKTFIGLQVSYYVELTEKKKELRAFYYNWCMRAFS